MVFILTVLKAIALACLLFVGVFALVRMNGLIGLPLLGLSLPLYPVIIILGIILGRRAQAVSGQYDIRQEMTFFGVILAILFIIILLSYQG